MTGFIFVAAYGNVSHRIFGIKDGTIWLRNHSLAISALVKSYSELLIRSIKPNPFQNGEQFIELSIQCTKIISFSAHIVDYSKPWNTRGIQILRVQATNSTIFIHVFFRNTCWLSL